jgi:hypothetical protein
MKFLLFRSWIIPKENSSITKNTQSLGKIICCDTVKSHSIVGLCHEHMLGIGRYSFGDFHDFGNWQMWEGSFSNSRCNILTNGSFSIHWIACTGHSEDKNNVRAGNSTPVKRPVASPIIDWTVWVHMLMNIISVFVQEYVLSFYMKEAITPCVDESVLVLIWEVIADNVSTGKTFSKCKCIFFISLVIWVILWEVLSSDLFQWIIQSFLGVYCTSVLKSYFILSLVFTL